MDSILIIGQSNMAGRGFPSEVMPIKNDRIYVMRSGMWRPMTVPINPDRPTSGISPAESFADEYTKEFNTGVGIIPAADGGTSIEMWREGSVLFDNAVFLAGLAKRSTRVSAILWHQGESDCTEERAPLYKARLRELIEALRRQTGLTDVPFILGGLGDFLPMCKTEKLVCHEMINAASLELSRELPLVGFASAVGLCANPDNLHFSAKAQREFGLRYFAEFKRLSAKAREAENSDSPKLSAIELL